ncbi:tetratricopeptide repeat protein [Hyphomonas sp.]|uniref:tetratricopeptide repeat protein n=1 Tax=Hyphomonas sp. TaxID=87 RepID=UPI00391BA9C0
MTPKPLLFASVLVLTLAGCTGLPGGSAPPASTEIVLPAVTLSPAAAATAVITEDGKPADYATPLDALKAGDTAGYLTLLARMPERERAEDKFNNAYLALDRASAGDMPGARGYLGLTGDEAADQEQPGFYLWIDAWLMALEGDLGGAINRHREVAGGMPGITADLSLAAMLEAAGRNDEALSVYEALTPTQIEAPEHEFDPQGIVFAHVSTVIVRHSLLLQRMGRIEESQLVYQQLADAEPEQATSYTAAIDSLETGKNLDNEPLTVKTGFAMALSDVSYAMQQQRYIQTVMMGGTITGLDDKREAFDLAILLIDPENENLRGAVIAALYSEALYAGAAHVALTAPEETPSLQISAAQALLMSGNEAAARGAIEKALSISDDKDRLSTLYGALQLRALLDDRDAAFDLVPELLGLAENPAEKAAALGASSSIYLHFGEPAKAAEYAKDARTLDDTHERRMVLADALGQAGHINEALVILRSERLARPNDPYTLNSLGYFLITRTDKYEEGYKVLARALLLAESDPYIADSFGWALFQLGDLDRAKGLIESAREELSPQSHWEIEDHLGDIYWHLDRKDEAYAAWKLALENYPPKADSARIAAKLADGLTTPRPEKRPLPEISLEDLEVERQDI